MVNTLSGRKSAEWECSKNCKLLTDVEIVAIVTLRAFHLGYLGCPFGQYTKLGQYYLKGHPIVCYTGNLQAFPLFFLADFCWEKKGSNAGHCFHALYALGKP